MISSILRELRRQRLIAALVHVPVASTGTSPFENERSEVSSLRPKGGMRYRRVGASSGISGASILATAAKSPLTPFIPERGLLQRGEHDSVTLAGATP